MWNYRQLNVRKYRIHRLPIALFDTHHRGKTSPPVSMYWFRPAGNGEILRYITFPYCPDPHPLDHENLPSEKDLHQMGSHSTRYYVYYQTHCHTSECPPYQIRPLSAPNWKLNPARPHSYISAHLLFLDAHHQTTPHGSGHIQSVTQKADSENRHYNRLLYSGKYAYL